MNSSKVEREKFRAAGYLELEVENYQNALDIFEQSAKVGDERAYIGMARAKEAAGLPPEEFFSDLLNGARNGEVFALCWANSLAKEMPSSPAVDEIHGLFLERQNIGDADFHLFQWQILWNSDFEEAIRHLLLAVEMNEESSAMTLADLICSATWNEDVKTLISKAFKKLKLSSLSNLDFDLSSISSFDANTLLSESQNETWLAIKKYSGIDSSHSFPAGILKSIFVVIGNNRPIELEKFNGILQHHFDSFKDDNDLSLYANPLLLIELAQQLRYFRYGISLNQIEEKITKHELTATYEKFCINYDIQFDEWELWEPVSASPPIPSEPSEPSVPTKDNAIDDLNEEIADSIDSVRSGEGSWKSVIKLFKKFRELDEEDLGETWFYEEQLTQLVNDNEDIFDEPGDYAVKDPKFFAALKEFIPVGGTPELTMASSKFCPKSIVMELLSPDYAPMDSESLSVHQVVAEMQSDVDYFKEIIVQGNDDRALHTLSARPDLPIELVDQLSRMQIHSIRMYSESGMYIESHLTVIINRAEMNSSILGKIIERANAVIAGGRDYSIDDVEMALEIEKAATKRLKSLS